MRCLYSVVVFNRLHSCKVISSLRPLISSGSRFSIEETQSIAHFCRPLTLLTLVLLPLSWPNLRAPTTDRSSPSAPGLRFALVNAAYRPADQDLGFDRTLRYPPLVLCVCVCGAVDDITEIRKR